MNREEIQSLMADYLGGELDATEKERFESALSAHPDLEQEVAELASTLSMVHFADPATGGISDRPEPRKTRRQMPGTVIRYAAAMIIAFFAGCYSYALISDSDTERAVQQESAKNTQSVEATSTASPKWETAFAGTYTRPGDRSRLARSWIALASTLRDG